MNDKVAGRLHSHDMMEQEKLFEHIKCLLSIRWIVGWMAGVYYNFVSASNIWMLTMELVLMD
jgi:hypothetical protein